MSLQIWLPLNGNLNNQGINGNIIPELMGTGITFTSGKIGQAATFPNNCNSCIHMPGFNLQKGSLCAWVKVNGEGAGANQRIISEGRDSYSDGTELILNKAGTQITFKSHKVSVSATIELNKWLHVACIFGNNNISLFINGIKKSTASYTEATPYDYSNNRFVLGKMSYSYTSASNYFPFNGQLNDVRLYDHILSVKEVEEISKGLVLHYKLDNGGGKNNNIKNSTIVNRGCTSFIYDKSTAEWTAVCPINSSTWGFGFYINDSSIKWAYGETWVISLEVYTPQAITWQCDINNKPDLADVSSYTGNDYDITGQRKVNTNGVDGSKNLQPGWNKIWFSQTASGSTYGLYNYSTNWGIVTTSLTDPITIKLRNIKGEIFQDGEVISSTPFIPNNNDLIQNNNIIYDSSGYENHGVIIGDIILQADTPRYNCSLSMNNVSTSNHIECTKEINPPIDGLSVSFWVKVSSKSTNQVIFAHPNIEFGFLNNLGYVYTNNSVAGFTLNNFINNAWNHIVVIRNGTTFQLYINNVAEIANGGSNNYNHNKTVLWLLNRGNNNSYAANASISDFRMYCTALTAEQIKELYNTSATIDKNGNVYAREVIE